MNSLPNATIAVIDFGTQVIDTNGAVTTGASWVFTAPEAGLYLVICAMDSLVTWTVDTFQALNARVNGSVRRRLDRMMHHAGSAAGAEIRGSTFLVLDKDDTVDFTINHTTSSNIDYVSASTTQAWCQIVRIGSVA